MADRWRTPLSVIALFAASLAVLVAMATAQLQAGEVRTISLYQVHTKERLTITYKKDGQYIPSAMKELNHLLRDWRRNLTITMDPETIDLMWELHADLGSKEPIHIICGYRSGETNAMLKRIGRNVAKQSAHIRGKAIDLYFPDVPTERLRNSALVRQVGGVGFYPSSGASGFVHIDSGSVRHWPRISEERMANIFRDYRKTVGARSTRAPQTLIAAATPSSLAKPKAVASSTGPVVIAQMITANENTASGIIPKPRPKPIDVLMLAAAEMKVEPAAAPPPRRVNVRDGLEDADSPLRNRLAPLITALGLGEDASLQQSNTAAKGSFAPALPLGRGDNEAATHTVAYGDATGGSLWTAANFASSQQPTSAPSQTYDPELEGEHIADEPEPITKADAAALESIVAALFTGSTRSAEEYLLPTGRPAATPNPAPTSARTAKGERQLVNRSAKGNLVLASPEPHRAGNEVSLPASGRSIAASADMALRSGEEPLAFR